MKFSNESYRNIYPFREFPGMTDAKVFLIKKNLSHKPLTATICFEMFTPRTQFLPPVERLRIKALIWATPGFEIKLLSQLIWTQDMALSGIHLS